MSDVEWADPPARGKYGAFFNELRANPGRWAKFPKKTSPSSTVTAVRAGRYVGADPGEFQAYIKDGVVYVATSAGDGYARAESPTTEEGSDD